MADTTTTPTSTAPEPMTTGKRIRVSRAFMQDTDSFLFNRVDGICKALDGNDSFRNLPVSLADLKANNATYSNLITAAQDGSKKAIAARKKMRHIIIGQLRLIAVYIEVASNGDVAVFLTSGFDPLPPRAATQPTPRPTIDKITHGKIGELVAKIRAVRQARHYQLNIAPFVNGQPGSWKTETVGKTRPAFIVTGLTPGTIYAFQVRAYGVDGFTDWSDTVTCMCT